MVKTARSCLHFFGYLFIALAFLPLAGCENSTNAAAVGTHVETMALKSLAGEPFTLPKKANNPVVMNIWATWCTPCVKELPGLIKLDKHQDVDVVAVSIDADPAKVKEFLKANDFTDLSVAWDENGTHVRQQLGLKGVPTSYILNQDKVVVGVEQGERAWDHPDMRDKINAYLKAGL